MADIEPGSALLGRIHKAPNDRKFYCYFTGFLEGIAASGAIEVGEIEPLVAQCSEFVSKAIDGDALDIVEDFDADLLTHESVKDIAVFRSGEIDLECSKSAINRFLGYCSGIACDDVITESEAETLVEFAAKNPRILEDIFVRSVVSTCKEALEDKIIDQRESSEICSSITRLVGDAYCDTGISSLGVTPVLKTVQFVNADSEIEGASMVLTGAFSISPRRLIEEELVARGATIGRTVSKKQILSSSRLRHREIGCRRTKEIN